MKPIRPIYDKKANNHERVQDRVHEILNGNVGIGSMNSPNPGSTESSGNLDNRHVIVTTPGAINTDFTVTHNLNRIPTGARISRASGLCNIWAGTVAWNTTTVTLQADHPGVVLTLEIY
jgi:hypothetical protein